MEHLYGFFYLFVPRFMTEFYECRANKPDGSPANYAEPPGPDDFLIEIRFFNFFGIPLFRKQTLYRSNSHPH